MFSRMMWAFCASMEAIQFDLLALKNHMIGHKMTWFAYLKEFCLFIFNSISKFKWEYKGDSINKKGVFHYICFVFRLISSWSDVPGLLLKSVKCLFKACRRPPPSARGAACEPNAQIPVVISGNGWVLITWVPWRQAAVTKAAFTSALAWVQLPGCFISEHWWWNKNQRLDWSLNYPAHNLSVSLCISRNIKSFDLLINCSVTS